MSRIVNTLSNIKIWTDIDVQSPTTKGLLLDRIERDMNDPVQLDTSFYEGYKSRYSTLGQTNIEMLRVSDDWKVGLNAIAATNRFKNLLKK